MMMTMARIDIIIIVVIMIKGIYLGRSIIEPHRDASSIGRYGHGTNLVVVGANDTRRRRMMMMMTMMMTMEVVDAPIVATIG